MKLSGRVAVVTGASRGIGLAVAQRLVAEGARVCVTARDEPALEHSVKLLGGADVAIGVPGRADDAEHRAAAIAATIAAFGPVELLVNNAGINPAYGPLLSLDLGAARKTLEVNLLAALGWVQAAFGPDRPGGDRRRRGAVVNISSVTGARPAPGISFYGVTKAALAHLTACLAVELAPWVRVNAVAPGVVKTRFATTLYEGKEDEVAAQYPLRRLGVPDDVAGAVAFLLSDDADWITGQTLLVDGGIALVGRGVT